MRSPLTTQCFVNSWWLWHPWKDYDSSWCLLWHHLNGEGALHSAGWGWRSTLPTWSPQTLYGLNSLLLEGGDENPRSIFSLKTSWLGCWAACLITALWKSRLPLNLCWHGEAVLKFFLWCLAGIEQMCNHFLSLQSSFLPFFLWSFGQRDSKIWVFFSFNLNPLAFQGY